MGGKGFRRLGGAVLAAAVAAGIATGLGGGAARPAAAASGDFQLSPPGPNIDFDFGTIRVGETRELSIDVTNVSAGPLAPTIVGGTPAVAAFSRVTTCTATLPPNQSCQLSYVFKPPTLGDFTDTVHFTVDGDAYSVNLRGTADPAFKVDPFPFNIELDFGNVPIGQTARRSVTFTNLSTVAQAPILKTAPPQRQPSGERADEFGIVNDCKRQVPPGSSCALEYTYTPTQHTKSEAVAQFLFDHPATQVFVFLSGNSPNAEPVGGDDHHQVAPGGTLSVPAPGVLHNDVDHDGHPITAHLVQGPANGDLTLRADGSFTYEPDPGFRGADSFVYVPDDGFAHTDATVTTGEPVTVNIQVRPTELAFTGDDDTARTALVAVVLIVVGALLVGIARRGVRAGPRRART